MSSNLIDIISKSSVNYVHNLTTLKSKRINETNSKYNHKENNYNFSKDKIKEVKEENFANSTNSGSFYDLIKKKKSKNSNQDPNSKTNRNNNSNLRKNLGIVYFFSLLNLIYLYSIIIFKQNKKTKDVNSIRKLNNKNISKERQEFINPRDRQKSQTIEDMNRILESQEMKMLNKKRKNEPKENLNKNKILLRKNVEENKINEKEIEYIKRKYQEQRQRNNNDINNEFNNHGTDQHRNNLSLNNNNNHNHIKQSKNNYKSFEQICYDDYESDIVIKKINNNKSNDKTNNKISNNNKQNNNFNSNKKININGNNDNDYNYNYNYTKNNEVDYLQKNNKIEYENRNKNKNKNNTLTNELGYTENFDEDIDYELEEFNNKIVI
jgi:hypothetical protein